MNLPEIAIIIPSLNPDEKFTRTVDGMIAAGFSRIILVDDGSDKDHKEPFEKAKEHSCVSVLLHKVNLGKGQALKDAFNYVYDNLPEIEAVITVDGDGQHTPEDTRKLADEIIAHPENVVFGCRDFSLKNVPTHNKLGNKITRTVFRLLFGMKITDAQTGLRAVPRKYLKTFANDVDGTRFEYESNVLIYMSENKIPYSEVKIQTLYIEENKSSHFHPVRDSIRIYKPILSRSTVFMFLVTGTICTLLDLIIYSLFINSFAGMHNIWLQNLVCNGLARIISAILNYSANYKYVFRAHDSYFKGMPKYFLLAAGKLISSWLIQTPLFSLLGLEGIMKTVLKAVVDLLLTVISYIVQKKWIFKKEGK